MQHRPVFLIAGEATSGKTSSLRHITNPEGVLYINCDTKPVTFRSKMKEVIATDPKSLPPTFQKAQTTDDIHMVVVDTLTFLMNSFEQIYIVDSSDSRSAWGDYYSFFHNLMTQTLAIFTKPVIFTAHVLPGEDAMGNITKHVPVKGSLKNTGVEAYFSIVVTAKRMRIVDLEKFPSNSMLNITDRDKELGYKNVFQVQHTKQTIGEQIRSLHDFWLPNEIFIDNNAQFLVDAWNRYYQ